MRSATLTFVHRDANTFYQFWSVVILPENTNRKGQPNNFITAKFHEDGAYEISPIEWTNKCSTACVKFQSESVDNAHAF